MAALNLFLINLNKFKGIQKKGNCTFFVGLQKKNICNECNGEKRK